MPDVLANVLQGLTESGKPIPAYEKTGKQRMDGIRRVLEKGVAVEEDLMLHRAEDNEPAAKDAQNLAVFGSLLGSCCRVPSGAVGLYLANRLTSQFGAKPGELREIAQGVATGEGEGDGRRQARLVRRWGEPIPAEAR